MNKYLACFLIVLLIGAGLVYYRPQWLAFIPIKAVQNSNFVQNIVNKEAISKDVFVKCPDGWDFFEYDLGSETSSPAGITKGCFKGGLEMGAQNFTFNPTYNKFTVKEARETFKQSMGTIGVDHLRDNFEGKDEVNSILNEFGFTGGLEGIADLAEMINIEGDTKYLNEIFEYKIPNGLILSLEGYSTLNFMGTTESLIIKLNYVVCDDGSGLFVNQASAEDTSISIEEFAKSFSCN
jgi:hypothetical protein